MKFKKTTGFYRCLSWKTQIGKLFRANLARSFALALVLALLAMLVQGSPASALSQQPDNGENIKGAAGARSVSAENADSKGSEQIFQKDETVYGILNYDGSEQSIEVVSHLFGQAGTWVDYGNYTSLQNLTDGRQPAVENDTITWESPAGQDLYYQGKIDKKLPWKIDIEWKLNGQKIHAEDLAGKSGKAEILMSVTAEPTSDEIYLKYYMLQIAVPLRMDKAQETVFSEGASQIVAGHTRTIAFTLLPGQTGDFKISFDAVNFAMDSIQISALPTGEQSGLGTLVTGLGQIGSGQQSVAEGTQELGDSLSAWTEGLGQIAAGLDQTQAAGGEIASGLNEYYQGMLNFQAGLESLVGNADQFGTALSEYAAQGPALSQGYAQLASQLNSMRLTPEKQQELLQLLALPDILPDGQSTVELKKMAESMLALNEGVTAVAEALAGANQGLLSYTDGAAAMSGNYDALLAGINSLPDSGQDLAYGLKQLKTGHSSYIDGTDQLRLGLVDSLQQGKPLPGALTELSSAQAELANGLAQIETEVSSLLPDKPAEPTSFAAPGRIRPQTVQFIITTPAIAAETGNAGADTDDQQAKTTFWQRLSGIFH